MEKGIFFLQFKFSFRNQEPGLGVVDISFTINHRQKSGYAVREVHLLRGTRRGRLGKEHNRSKGTMSCYSQVGPCTSPPHLPSQLGGGVPWTNPRRRSNLNREAQTDSIAVLEEQANDHPRDGAVG